MASRRVWVESDYTDNIVPLCEATAGCDRQALGVTPVGLVYAGLPEMTPICRDCCTTHGVKIIQGFGVLPDFEEAQR